MNVRMYVCIQMQVNNTIKSLTPIELCNKIVLRHLYVARHATFKFHVN